MSERLLIVDDDLDSRKLISMMLQRQGYHIITADSGAQALQRAARQHPDLIILDIMMPDMDGYEVARHLRTDARTAHIPIIMFTAKSMMQDKVTGYEAGADDYVTKPAHPTELATRIRVLLNRSKGQSAAVATDAARIISVVGVKGGTGTTTVALNAAVAMAAATGESRVVIAELSPAHGTLGLYMGYDDFGALGRLAGLSLEELSGRAVEDELVSHKSGVRLLLASPVYDADEMRLTPESVHVLAEKLASISDYLVLDLGAGVSPIARTLIAISDQVLVCLEPNRIAIELGKYMLAELREMDLGISDISLVQISRAQSALQVSWQSVQQALGVELLGIVSAAPDLAYQADEAQMPMIAVQPNSVTAGQFRQLGEDLLLRVGSLFQEPIGEGR